MKFYITRNKDANYVTLWRSKPIKIGNKFYYDSKIKNQASLPVDLKYHRARPDIQIIGWQALRLFFDIIGIGINNIKEDKIYEIPKQELKILERTE